MPPQPAIAGSRTFVGPSAGGPKSAKFIINGGDQANASSSGDAVKWDQAGHHYTDWDDLGCTFESGGYAIKPPTGLYIVTCYVMLSAPACVSGIYRIYGPNISENSVAGVSGYMQVGQELKVSFSDVTDIGPANNLMIIVFQSTGQTLYVEEVSIGIVRIGDTHSGGGG